MKTPARNRLWIECTHCESSFNSTRTFEKHLKEEIALLGWEQFCTFLDTKIVYGYQNQDLLKRPISSPAFKGKALKLVLR